MDFERVLVIGSSGGIGSALSQEVSAHEVVTLCRSEDGFEITDEANIAGFAESLPGPFDLILNTVGALEIDGVGPEKSMAAISAQAMAAQFAVNAMGTALIIKHFADHLPRDGRAVFANLSARVGSIGDNNLGGWISYRAAKAAQNQIIKTASIELARRNKETVCVAIHPGTVRTDLTAKYVGAHPAVLPQEAARNILNVIEKLSAEQTGGFFDWRGTPVPW